MIKTIRGRRETLDQLDIEALTELQDSRAWSLVLDRVEKVLTQQMAELLHAKTWDEALRAQGKIDATQLLRTLPKILIAEAREEARKKQRNG